jgi:hypothetical protein
MDSEKTRRVMKSSSLSHHDLRQSSHPVHRKRPFTITYLRRGESRRKVKNLSQRLSGILCPLYAILIVNTFSSIALASSRSADYGGNRGWALGLSGTDDYASVAGYFSDHTSWPTYEVTGMNQKPCEGYMYFYKFLF